MEEFIFNENPKEQQEDFIKFIGETKNLKLINVTCDIGEQVQLWQTSSIAEMLNDTLDEETNVNFDVVVDEQLSPKQIILKIQKVFN